jgi:hypothetical protein
LNDEKQNNSKRKDQNKKIEHKTPDKTHNFAEIGHQNKNKYLKWKKM